MSPFTKVMALAILIFTTATPAVALDCRQIRFKYEGVFQSGSSCYDTCYRAASTARAAIVADPDHCQAADEISAVVAGYEDLGTCESCGTAFLSCKCDYEFTMWRAYKNDQEDDDGKTVSCSNWEIAKRMANLTGKYAPVTWTTANDDVHC